MRLLVVEDNVDASDSLSEVLRLALGADVVCSYGPEDGLEAARKAPFDVCVLDIGLPVMDGYTLARSIVDCCNRKPLLIAYTGYGERHHIEKSIQAGFDHHVVKSCPPERIVELIRKSIHHMSVTEAEEGR